MATAFQNFVNLELPKRISIEIPDSGNLSAGYLLKTTGTGLLLDYSLFQDSDISDLQTATGNYDLEISDLQDASGIHDINLQNLNIHSGIWSQDSNTIYSSGIANVIISGNLDLYKSNADTILTIGSVASYNPQIRLKKDSTILWSLGADNVTNNFVITPTATGVGGQTHFNMTTDGHIGVGILPNSTKHLHIYEDVTNLSGNIQLSSITNHRVTSSSQYNARVWNGTVTTYVDNGITNSGSVSAILVEAINNGLGRTTYLRGLHAEYGNYPSAGLVTYCQGIYLQGYYNAGTIDNFYDVYIANPSAGGTITNDWCIYSLHDAPSRFVGHIQIDADSRCLHFGADQDAGICYDGTNLVYDSDLVGTGYHQFVNKVEVKKAQNTNAATFTDAHLRLADSSVTDTTGTTAITLAVSTVDNYGVSLAALRYTAGGTPSFSMRLHNNSAAGTEIVRAVGTDFLFPISNVGIGVPIGTSPVSLLEVYSSVAHPVITITGVHASSYHPQIQFKMGASPTVRFSVGVNETTKFVIAAGTSGVIGGDHFCMDNYGTIGLSTDPYTNAAQWVGVTQSHPTTDQSFYGLYQHSNVCTITNTTARVSYGFLFDSHVRVSAGVTNSGSCYGIEGYSTYKDADGTYTGTFDNIYGVRIRYGIDTAGAGTTVTNVFGINLASYRDRAITNFYDIHITTPVNNDVVPTNDWCIYSDHAAASRLIHNLQFDTDSYGIVLGAGQDTKIYYDGTNMIFDSQVVGTGDFIFRATTNPTIRIWDDDLAATGAYYYFQNAAGNFNLGQTTDAGGGWAGWVTRLQINAGGFFGIGGSSQTNRKLYVTSDLTDINGHYVLYAQMYQRSSVNGGYGAAAFYIDAHAFPASGTTNSGTAMGIYDVMTNNATGTITYLHGANFRYGNTAGAGVISYCIGLNLACQADVGTITNLYDIYIEAPTAGGAITNQWCIYSSHDAPSRFIGHIQIDADSRYLYLGADQDAALYYDGTNMVYNSALVGTGYHQFVNNVEVYSSVAHPVITITGAHATDYDPTIAFRTGVAPSEKWAIYCDATDSRLKFRMAGTSMVGAVSELGSFIWYGGATANSIAIFTSSLNPLTTTTSNVSGLSGAVHYNPSTNSSYSATGLTFDVYKQGAYNCSAITGSRTESNMANGSAGTVPTFIGAAAYLSSTTSTVTGTTAIGLNLYPILYSGNRLTYTTRAGIRIGDFSALFDSTTAYDILIEAKTGAGTVTNDWCIYSDHAAASRLVHNLQFDTDSYGTVYGAGSDAKVYYDGTVLQINSSLVAASDIDITCGANKTIELQNVVYDDLQFVVSFGKVSAANVPTWEVFTANTNEYAFDVDDYIDLAANELPHWWKQGTAGHVHLHITTQDANASGASRYAKFTVYAAYVDTDEEWVETSFTQELTIPNGTAALHAFYLDMGDLTLTNYLIGGEIKIRIKRIAATGGTEYADEIFVNQCGIHLEKDTMGSRQEIVK